MKQYYQRPFSADADSYLFTVDRKYVDCRLEHVQGRLIGIRGV